MIQENGAKRHTMTKESLEGFYRAVDNFLADCTAQEASENRDAFIAIKTLIHKRLQEK